jgi:ribosome-binding factor A
LLHGFKNLASFSIINYSGTAKQASVLNTTCVCEAPEIIMKTKRQLQISSQIKRELAQILLRMAQQPIFKRITIVGVEVSPDLAVAKVFFSVFDELDIDAALHALKDSAGTLRYALAKSLNLRNTPRLNFIYDATIKYGQKLSLLIDEAIEADAKLHEEQNEA